MYLNSHLRETTQKSWKTRTTLIVSWTHGKCLNLNTLTLHISLSVLSALRRSKLNMWAKTCLRGCPKSFWYQTQHCQSYPTQKSLTVRLNFKMVKQPETSTNYEHELEWNGKYFLPNVSADEIPPNIHKRTDCWRCKISPTETTTVVNL